MALKTPKARQRRTGGGFAQHIRGVTLPLRLVPDSGDGGNVGGGAATQDPPAGGGPSAPPAAPAGGDGNEALLHAVQQRAEEVVGPIRQKLDDLAKQLGEAEQPASRAQGATPGRLFGGGAPNVQTGPTWGKLESSGYRYSRAYAQALGDQNAMPEDGAKLELDVHQRLLGFYRQNGFQPAGVNSVLMPFGTSEITEIEQGFGQELRQMVHQGLAGADPGHVKRMAGNLFRQSGMNGGMLAQALSAYDDSAMGVFTSTGMGEMIELIRAREIFSQLGASQITLPPNGFLAMPRQTGASDAYWVGESQTITQSEPTTGQIEMRARKLACLVPFPNELLRFQTASVEAFIRNDMAASMAVKADTSMLFGKGTTVEPRGLINYNIQSHTPGTVAANGNTLEPADPAAMLTALRESDYDLDSGFSWVISPTLFNAIRNKRTSVYDGTNTAELGPWLFNLGRDLATGQPTQMEGQSVVQSSKLTNTRSKGSSDGTLTFLLGGLFPNWVIGNHGVMEFATATTDGTDFQQDRQKVRAIRHMDAIPRRENAFIIADQLNASL